MVEHSDPPREWLIIESFPVDPGGQRAVDRATFAVVATSEGLQKDHARSTTTHAPIACSGLNDTLSESNFEQRSEESNPQHIARQGTLHKTGEGKTKWWVELC